MTGRMRGGREQARESETEKKLISAVCQKRPSLFARRNRRGLIDSFVYIAPRLLLVKTHRVATSDRVRRVCSRENLTKKYGTRST